jgi:hypothetical protein
MSDLLDALSHRPCAGSDDFLLMQTLCRTRYGAAQAAGFGVEERPWFPSAGDLDWWRATSSNPALPGNIELWFDGAELAAFVWHNGEDSSINVAWGRDALYPSLLDWAEARAIALWQAGASDEPLVFEEPCLNSNRSRQALLQARGYQLTTHASDQDHFFDLTGELPPRRTLPPGFIVRNLQGLHEVEARVSVHRAAFAPSRMTVAKHRAVMASPMYRLDFDLVVEAPGWPEGAPLADEGCTDSPCFAAYTIVWYDEANRWGVFEPVGCRPEFQRRGLASAVMIEGMHRLRALGATHATVGAHGGSPGAKTYSALGGYLAQQYDLWTRTLATPSGSPSSMSQSD